MKKIYFFILALFVATPGWSTVYEVLNNASTNSFGSLSRAIQLANMAGGADTITFSAGLTIIINTPADYTITDDKIYINGTGSNVILRGGTSVVNAITLNGCDLFKITGVTFQNFTGSALNVMNATNFTISGCRFGTTPTATANSGYTNGYGIFLGANASNGKIGGSTVAERNYFMACTAGAIYNNQADDITITGNYFGFSSTGAVLAGTQNLYSIFMSGCTGNIIGRNNANERNLFTNSTSVEVYIQALSTQYNTISGNYFGYSPTFTTTAYRRGIELNGAYNNLIQYNFFSNLGGTYVPVQYTGICVGNRFRRNSFNDFSGGTVNTADLVTRVVTPKVYSQTNQIIKGWADPGDSVEIYYSNAPATAGYTYIATVKAGTDGKWIIKAGGYTPGDHIVVTATNDQTNTTSWFYQASPSSQVYTCTNNANAYRGTICKNAILTGPTFVNGSIGTTTPPNAATWTHNGQGTFSPSSAYAPGGIRYIPTAKEIAGFDKDSIRITLRTNDTNCVNTTSSNYAVFNPIPKIDPIDDIYSCSSNKAQVTSTPALQSSGQYYIYWQEFPPSAGISLSNTGPTPAYDSTTYTIVTPGTYKLIKHVYYISTYCENADTFQVMYKPNPIPNTSDSIITVSNKAGSVVVTKNDNLGPGELLTLQNVTGGIAGSTVASIANRIFYTSPDGYIGNDFTVQYSLRNTCNNTAGPFTLLVRVRNAPPKVVSAEPIQTTRKIDNSVSDNISNYITDVNSNLNFGDANNDLTIIKEPISGANVFTATNGDFIVDYTTPEAEQFVGEDFFVYQICDVLDSCSIGIMRIYRAPNYEQAAPADSIVVFNGISPDGDGINDFLRINNMADYMTTVMIYNRWGEKVWEGENYDNLEVKFEGISSDGTELPEGTYFYVIRNDNKEQNGENKGLVSGPLELRRLKN